MKIVKTITEYYREINLPPPKHASFHIGRHEENLRTIPKVQSPIKHNLYSISLTSAHSGKLTINYNRVKFQLFIISPFKVINWDITGQQIKGLYIIFDGEFISSNPLWSNFLADFPFFRYNELVSKEVPQSLTQSIYAYFEEILREYHTPGPEQFDIIRSHVQTVLLLLKRYFNSNRDSALMELPANSRLLGEFESLLLETMSACGPNPEFRKPSFYAARLSIHPNHLNAIVKQLTGKTASTFIHEHIIQQASLLLRQTALPVKEIASRFHFSQTTHFILFFKKQTGLTPRHFKMNATPQTSSL